MKRLNKLVFVWAMLLMYIASAIIIPEQSLIVAKAEAESSWNVLKIVEAQTVPKVYTIQNVKKSTFIAQLLNEKVGLTEDTGDIVQEIIQEEQVAQEVQETQETATIEEAPVSEWANRVMAKVEESANVRQMPDAESDLAGRIRKGDAATIVEQTEEWTLISSGNVLGYVKNEFLAFGEEAEAMANQQGKVAIVQVDGLRVRKEANEEAGIVTVAKTGDRLAAVAEENGWINVTLSSGNPGFVKMDYVAVELVLGTAITIEEEQAAIRAENERIAKEKAASEAKAAKSQTVFTTQRGAIEVSVDDVTLLGALVQMEAGGESYEGKLAVASVVINRVNRRGYPSTISGVIYQQGQFPGAGKGLLSKILARGVKSECIRAAKEAISGTNNIGSYMHFNRKSSVNTSRLSSYLIIGNHCFY